MRRWFVLSLVFALLTGCSTLNPYNSDFGCEGHPDGVNCMSAREVYRETDYKSSLSREDMQDKKGNKKGKRPDEQHPAAASSVNPAVDPPTSAVQGMPYEGPLPLRTTAQVMRIWVAPWESRDGALNMPSYIYVEVVERKWTVGEAKMHVAPQVTPLQHVEAPDAEGAAPRTPRPQQLRTPPRPAQQPAKQQPGPFGRATGPEKSKAIPGLPGFNGPMGQNPQQNVFPKAFSGLPEEF
ncbi:MAG: type IV conjugative transfer system lipoprotein TraV [Thermodesulfobacteriota bacterium]